MIDPAQIPGMIIDAQRQMREARDASEAALQRRDMPAWRSLKEQEDECRAKVLRLREQQFG